MRSIRWIIGIVLLASAGGLWLWGTGRLQSAQEVEAARIRRGALEVVLPVTGVFETTAVTLAFEIPGRLAAVAADEGAAVRRGQVLASLDAAELRTVAAQADAAARAAASDAARAGAAVDGARQQAAQAEAAYRAARANLAQLQAGARPFELQQADAAVAQARAMRDQAKRSLDAQERLFREGAVSRAQLDTALAQYESAEAAYRQAVAQRDAIRAGARPEAITAAAAQVAQAKAAWQAALANVRQAQAAAAAARAHAAQAAAAARAAHLRAARADLRAPFDGIVTRVHAQVGASVSPAVPVVSLAAASGWITAEVEESDIGRVRLGMPARVRADAYPGRTFSGRVTAIGRQVELRLGTRTVRARIDLDTPAQLRAGTSVDADLLVRVVPDALLAPLEAVQTGENGTSHVYLVVDGVLRRRQVTTGPADDVQVVITAGVREGDLVALADPALLRDGLRVRVRSVR